MNEATPGTWTFMSIDRDQSVVRTLAADAACRKFVRTEQEKTHAALAARKDLRRPRLMYEMPDGNRVRESGVIAASMQIAMYAIDCYESRERWPENALHISKKTSMSTRQVNLAMAVMVEIGRAVALYGGWKLDGDGEDWTWQLENELYLATWEMARHERLLNLLSKSGKCGLGGCPLFGGAVLAERLNGTKYEACAACATCVENHRKGCRPTA